MNTENSVVSADRNFELGQLVITKAARESLLLADVIDAVRRHSNCDWGDLDERDKEANETALTEETRLFSAYRSESGIRFYIITEYDRSATSILLPEDY